MSGNTATLTFGVASSVFNALQSYQAAAASNASAIAASRIAQHYANAQAQMIEASAGAQALTLERQAGVRRFQAEQFSQRADLTEARLALRMAQEGREGRRRQGSRRAQFAGRGITRRGTPTDILADTAAEEALNLAIIDFEGRTRATQFEQGAVLKRHEASLLSQEAGIARSLGSMRASFVRQMGGIKANQLRQQRVDPTAAAFASGFGTMLDTGIPEMVGGWLANGVSNLSFTPEIEAGTGRRSRPPRRSIFRASMLS